MSYRAGLPQLEGELFLTDGGLETTLIFREGIELPLFAAYALLGSDEGRAALRNYYEPYLAIARERDTGFVLESPTWRASARWGAELGHSPEQLDALNREAIAMLEEIRQAEESPERPFVVSGCIGPQGDGYHPAGQLTVEDARDYHSAQIGTFADTSADMIAAATLTYTEEAIGIAQAAADASIPAVISFTVETDGRLPSGQPLGEAIEQLDGETAGTPAYLMINCAHPTHFAAVLEEGGAWRERIQGLCANASRMSHAELDEAEELDDGDPDDLAERYVALRETLPRLNVLGGGCGTDDRHVGAIATAWTVA